MKMTTMGGLATLTLMLAAPLGLSAQRGPLPGPAARAEILDRLDRGRPGAPAVEAVLRLRERLQLTEDQVARLDEIRGRRVEERLAARARMEEVRSRLRAGTIERENAADALRTLRAERLDRRQEERGEIESLLSESQRSELDRLRAERRAFERGRRVGLREGEGRFRGAPDARRYDARPGPRSDARPLRGG